MRIGCNNVKIKYLLLQRLINVVTQIFVATMNGICCNWQIFGRDSSKLKCWQVPHPIWVVRRIELACEKFPLKVIFLILKSESSRKPISGIDPTSCIPLEM